MAKYKFTERIGFKQAVERSGVKSYAELGRKLIEAMEEQGYVYGDDFTFDLNSMAKYAAGYINFNSHKTNTLAKILGVSNTIEIDEKFCYPEKRHEGKIIIGDYGTIKLDDNSQVSAQDIMKAAGM